MINFAKKSLDDDFVALTLKPHTVKVNLELKEASVADLSTQECRTFKLNNVSNLPHVRRMKQSVDGIYLGILAGAKEFLVVDSEGVKVLHIMGDIKKSNFIHGFEWTFARDLLLICSDCIEFYKVTQ